MSQQPDTRVASQSELNKFVEVVDEFKTNLARLTSPEFERQVYAFDNPALHQDYGKAVVQARALNSTIDATVGAWNAFKRGYLAATDASSTVIGDAIDEIRSWFGYKPAGDLGRYELAGLGAIQIPAAAWVAGIIAAALVLNRTMAAIFVQVEAAKLQRENPGMSREVALQKAKDSLPSLFGAGITVPLVIAGIAAVWLLSNRK